VAVGYWALVALAVRLGGPWQASPAGVVRACRRVGWRALVAALLVGVAVTGHVPLVFDALEALHTGPGGWLGMAGCWVSMLFWIVFALRWLGLACFRSRKENEGDAPLEVLPARGARVPL
jgi:hypothetical protein